MMDKESPDSYAYASIAAIINTHAYEQFSMLNFSNGKFTSLTSTRRFPEYSESYVPPEGCWIRSHRLRL
ncbi:hypothetical protein M513_08758, partial [Trichuris suis]